MARKYVFKRKWKRAVASFVDAIGRICFGQKKKPLPQNFRKILLVRIDQLGDVLFTIPAVKALAKKFPDAEIDYLGGPWAEPVIRCLPEIKRFIPFPDNWFSATYSMGKCKLSWKRVLALIKGGGYDLAVDFRGDLRNIFTLYLAGVPYTAGYGITGGGFLLNHCPEYSFTAHQVEADLDLLKAFGCGTDKPEMSLAVSDEGRKLADRFFRILPHGVKKIVVHMGAGYSSKRWGFSRYLKLVRAIVEKKIGIVLLVGNEEEKALTEGWTPQEEGIYNLIGQTSLPELMGVIEQCDLFIGNDSGPSHLAAALGKKEVILFSGTNDPAIWKPWNPDSVLLKYDVPCSPCELKVCSQPKHLCMENITVEAVLEKIEGIL